jgi:exoribonuclease R
MPFLRTRNYKQFEVVDETSDTVLHTFEGAAKANKALPGDEVTLDASKNVILGARAPHPPLAGYLELNSKTTYGLTKKGMPLFLFVPLNPSYPSFIVSSSDRDRSCKKIAVIDFLEWTHDRVLPRGALKQILGPATDLESEEAALLWTACPWNALTEGLTVLEDDCPKRSELKGTTYNIDPEGCKDIDDCVTLFKDGQDWLLTITIADVASAVEEMSAVDCMAANQGQTLYREGVAVKPMLPRYYSEEHCSLIPGHPRRGVSLTLRFDKDLVLAGDPVWSETLITNQKSYSYEDVEGEDVSVLGCMVSALKGHVVDDPHEWIEVLMVLYNTEAAKLLLTAGVGILRVHSAPDLAKLERYAAMDPELKVLASKAAIYTLIGSQETYQHWGLDAAAYCHASSPIRRYADLANQRILKQLIRGNKQGLIVSVPVSDLNERAKVSKGYERDRVFLNALLKEGQREFEALILDLVEESGQVKCVLWIHEWQQKVKCRYALVEILEIGYKVRSADESKNYELKEGLVVRIECGLNLGASRWKDRVVITLLDTETSAAQDL